MTDTADCPTCGARCRVEAGRTSGAETLVALQDRDLVAKIEQLKAAIQRRGEKAASPPALMIVYVRGLAPETMPAMKAYSEAVAPLFSRLGARPLARGPLAATLEGDWPWQAVAAFAWDSAEAAQAAWASPEDAEAKRLRDGGGIEFQAVVTKPLATEV